MTILASTAHRGGQVTIPKTSGGCGETHLYEDTRTGYPGITCPACEDVLRGDPQHATLASKVPETHDETLIREDIEKRGAQNQQQMIALAFAKMANIPGAEEAFGTAMGAASAICPAGHQNTAGSRFCAECGEPVSQPGRGSLCPEGHPCAAGVKFCGECGTPVAGIDAKAVTAAASGPSPDDQPPAESAEDRSGVRLQDRRADELRQICKDMGLDDGGTRAEMIARVRAATA